MYPLSEQEQFARHLLDVIIEYGDFCREKDRQCSFQGFMVWLATRYQYSAYREQQYALQQVTTTLYEQQSFEQTQVGRLFGGSDELDVGTVCPGGSE